jgi:hypothetical protein
VRDNYIEQCTHAEAALYLFLVCVSDHRGLSYYGDKSLMVKLTMDRYSLQTARSGLVQKNLIAWQKPIYQVLSLDTVQQIRNTGSTMSLGDILKTAMEVSRD